MNSEAGGFTLVELLVAVLIVGVLAAIAVPQYVRAVEGGRVSEALQWIDSLRGAQERYLARNGGYFAGAVDTEPFDASLGKMRKFSSSSVTASSVPSWTVALTRSSPCPAVYGCYTITYRAPSGVFTCSDSDCADDLLPDRGSGRAAL